VEHIEVLSNVQAVRVCDLNETEGLVDAKGSNLTRPNEHASHAFGQLELEGSNPSRIGPLPAPATNYQP